MSIVKFFPPKSDEILTAAAGKVGYLSAKSVNKNESGTLDLVVSVPEGSNRLVKNVSDKKSDKGYYEEVKPNRSESVEPEKVKAPKAAKAPKAKASAAE